MILSYLSYILRTANRRVFSDMTCLSGFGCPDECGRSGKIPCIWVCRCVRRVLLLMRLCRKKSAQKISTVSFVYTSFLFPFAIKRMRKRGLILYVFLCWLVHRNKNKFAMYIQATCVKKVAPTCHNFRQPAPSPGNQSQGNYIINECHSQWDDLWFVLKWSGVCDIVCALPRFY